MEERMIRIAMLAWLLILSGAFEAHARALAAGNAAVGKIMAKTWCSSCHLIDKSGTTADGARPFAAIARDPQNTPDRLTGFLSEPHGDMAELPLSRQEIQDLISYIESLK
jgi:mono/diheme cytochrome c family protein